MPDGFLNLFSDLWLCWVSVEHGLSPGAVSGVCSPVAMRGRLIARAALVAEHGLQGSAAVAQAQPPRGM